MSNPIAFCKHNSYYDFQTNFGQEHYVKEPEEGKTYLKFTIRYIERTHDGYCSGYDFERTDDVEIANKKINILKLYFDIPKYLCDENGNIKREYLRDESSLISNYETEDLFFDWTNHSNCDGSGYCNLFDTYIPIMIEYVKIV